MHFVKARGEAFIQTSAILKAKNASTPIPIVPAPTIRVALRD
jgi:hypothetical protein